MLAADDRWWTKPKVTEKKQKYVMADGMINDIAVVISEVSPDLAEVQGLAKVCVAELQRIIECLPRDARVFCLGKTSVSWMNSKRFLRFMCHHLLIYLRILWDYICIFMRLVICYKRKLLFDFLTKNNSRSCTAERMECCNISKIYKMSVQNVDKKSTKLATICQQTSFRRLFFLQHSW